MLALRLTAILLMSATAHGGHGGGASVGSHADMADGPEYPESNSSLPHYAYKIEKVEFPSQGVTVRGVLYVPNDGKSKHPAVTLIGPFAFVKEQSPMQYATRMAQLGYVTLIFDPRFHGESDGKPRRFESPTEKIKDVSASIDFLQKLPYVDKDKIACIAICQGAAAMMVGANKEPRIKVLAAVTGSYLDPENIEHFVGGKDNVKARIARGKAALEKYKTTGKVEYIEIIDPERKDVGLPHKGIWAWYMGWPPRSRWENRYTVMSDAEVWAYDAYAGAKQLKTPLIMVHADRSDGPITAKKFFKAVPAADKKLVWMGDTLHTQFYDDPEIIDQAVDKIYMFFQKYLG